MTAAAENSWLQRGMKELQRKNRIRTQQEPEMIIFKNSWALIAPASIPAQNVSSLHKVYRNEKNPDGKTTFWNSTYRIHPCYRTGTCCDLFWCAHETTTSLYISHSDFMPTDIPGCRQPVPHPFQCAPGSCGCLTPKAPEHIHSHITI